MVCPFCSVMYEGNQKSIESEYETEYKIPVLYLTHILGMATGLTWLTPWPALSFPYPPAGEQFLPGVLGISVLPLPLPPV